MSPKATENHNEQRLNLVASRLETGSLSSLRSLINALHPAEIAHLLESLQPSDRKLVWALVVSQVAGEVLVELNDEVRNGLIEATNAEDLISATESLASDDLVDLLKDFPAVVLDKVLESMDMQNRSRLESVLSFDDDTAGGLMSMDALTVRADVVLDVVFRYLRLRGEIPALTDSLIVVNRYDDFQGVLPLSVLLTHEPQATVA